jgi:hypothetical protein
MDKRNFVLVFLLLAGCSEVPPPPAGEQCSSDEDCRNSYHCNLYFNTCEANECSMVPIAEVPGREPDCAADVDCRNGSHCNLCFNLCEPNDYDAATRLDDGGFVVEADSGMVIPNLDAGMEGPDSQVASDVDSSVGVDAAVAVDSSPRGHYHLAFDGNDSVSIPDSFTVVGQRFTYEVWVRPTTATYPSDVGGFIFMRRYPNEDIILFFSRSGNGKFGFQVGDRILLAPDVSALNEWHHVAGVFNSGTLTLYIDGFQVASMSSSYVVQNRSATESYVIGQEGDPTDATPRGRFVGDLDEVRISGNARYDRPFIPPSRLIADANAVGTWLMDDGVGWSVTEEVNADLSSLITGADWVLCTR